MKQTYSITLQCVLPVLARISIEANNEWEAAMLAERLGESQRKNVKTTAFQIEPYAADFLTVQDLSEITPVNPAAVGKVWNRNEIEQLLGG
jgi:hypothetical protein